VWAPQPAPITGRAGRHDAEGCTPAPARRGEVGPR
jgi:hypothetical protein